MIPLVVLSESLVSHSIVEHPFLKRCFFVFSATDVWKHCHGNTSHVKGNRHKWRHREKEGKNDLSSRTVFY